jgi:hypothetical protein
MKTPDLFAQAADVMSRSNTASAYADRHTISSAPNLTVTTDEIAELITDYLEPRIRDKTVLDLGGGIGLLGIHMAAVARKVIVIEANPLWTLAWVELLQRKKPANLSYCFGTSAEFEGAFKADIVTVCSHSGVKDMLAAGRMFSENAIDVYGELVARNPAAFGAWAREERLK